MNQLDIENVARKLAIIRVFEIEGVVDREACDSVIGMMLYEGSIMARDDDTQYVALTQLRDRCKR